MSWMAASTQQQQHLQQLYESPHRRETGRSKLGTPLANGLRVQTLPSASSSDTSSCNYERTYSLSGTRAYPYGVGYANYANDSLGYAPAAMRCAPVPSAQSRDTQRDSFLAHDCDVPTAASVTQTQMQQLRAAAAPTLRNHSHEEYWRSVSTEVQFVPANVNGAQQPLRKRSGGDAYDANQRTASQQSPVAHLSPRISPTQAGHSPKRSIERPALATPSHHAENSYSSEALFFSTPKSSSLAAAVRCEAPRKWSSNMYSYESDYLSTPPQVTPRKSLGNGNCNFEREQQLLLDSNSSCRGSAGELSRSPRRRLVRRSVVEDENCAAPNGTMCGGGRGGGGWRSTSPSERERGSPAAGASGCGQHQRSSDALANGHFGRTSENHRAAHACLQPEQTRARLFVALVSYNVDDGCDAPANGDIWFRKGQILQVLSTVFVHRSVCEPASQSLSTPAADSAPLPNVLISLIGHLEAF